MSAVSVEAVSRTFAAVLANQQAHIHYRNAPTGSDLPISHADASSPDMLLPAFVVAGEAVWREATGVGFSLDVVRDSQATFGFRLRGIRAGSLTTVMLSMMEAMSRVDRNGTIAVQDLNAVWAGASERADAAAARAAGLASSDAIAAP